MINLFKFWHEYLGWEGKLKGWDSSFSSAVCRTHVLSRIRFGCKWQKVPNDSGLTRLTGWLSRCPWRLAPLPAHHSAAPPDWPSPWGWKCSFYIPGSRIKGPWKKRAKEKHQLCLKATLSSWVTWPQLAAGEAGKSVFLGSYCQEKSKKGGGKKAFVS